MIPNLLQNWFGPNWRTSALGIVEGASTLSIDLADAYTKGMFNGVHGVGLLVAVAMVWKGFMAKDKQVTGSSNEQA